MEDLDADLATLISNPDFFILPASDDFASIPQDPLNPITAEKVELGKFLFHETATGGNPKLKNDYDSEGTYSCASCHHVAAGFRAGRKQGLSEGGVGWGLVGEARVMNPKYEDYLDSLDVQPIRSPTAMNGAYQDVMLWNGQFGATKSNAGTEANWTPGTPKAVNALGFEGLEIQAIAAQDVHRLKIDEDLLNEYPEYKDLFDAAYGTYDTDPQTIKELGGLAMAAYERILLSNEAPFQQYLKGNKSALTDTQKRGAILFFGKAKCVQCHTGPALNSMAFEALGINEMKGEGTFNTEGDKPERFGRGSFTNNPDDNYKFKVPQLYNLKDDDFFGHGATFTSVRDIVEYKNQAVPQNAEVPASQLAEEFIPLDLTSEEVDQLTEFLEEALYDDNLVRYVPESLPSGFFFPVNDVDSQDDMGIMGGI
ncbi:MAG: cytochrome-c peroxidase [Cyclobacteriaceae bacterium]|nr:MAG: cytochrome-c peroxidase [Cyclobacteriaceae bacterium]